MKFGLEETDIKKIQAVFAAFPEVEKAVLYGSRAKGNFKPASDIDLTLTGKNLNLSIANAIAIELDDLLLPYMIDLSIFHQISNTDLTEHINRVGQLFYEKALDKRSIVLEK
jgi:predicted nucleotidyltransferase